MAPKHHPTPLSGGDRKALTQGARQGARDDQHPGCAVGRGPGQGRGLIRQADKLLCESWNERMWADGEPIDPSPTIDQAVNGGFPWLEIECSRCKTPSDVDLAALKPPADHLRARPRQPAALPEMRQGRPPSGGDPAATGAGGRAILGPKT